ncbi:MAG TPA: restriction endonuclease [Phycisphaerae bacterium]|nr:restriction endonuclease [Phycisphaerae bacterium]
MSAADRILWGIHAGRTGEADTLFLKENMIALGWSALGDLSKLGADRAAFKAKIREEYPNAKDGQISTWAGQLFRFVHEMKPGDHIAYPSKSDRTIHLGRIEGEYRYDPVKAPRFFNLRQVKWIKSVPRSHFTQGALYEIGAALSLFQIKNYADEYFAAIEGKAAPAPVADDQTIAAVAADIDETTYDFVIKRLAQETKGHPFAHFVAHLMGTMGYKTRVSPEGPDGGVDIIAHKDELGFEPPIIKVQCKSSEATVSDHDVSAFYGKVSTSEFGLYVSLGSFSSKAAAFAKSKPNLRLIDGEELVTLIFEHYEQFDSLYKGLLPLRRVYVPEAINEDEE